MRSGNFSDELHIFNMHTIIFIHTNTNICVYQEIRQGPTIAPDEQIYIYLYKYVYTHIYKYILMYIYKGLMYISIYIKMHIYENIYIYMHIVLAIDRFLHIYK